LKKNSVLINLAILILSLLICFVITEIGWHLIIFSDIEIFKNQKQASLYADPLSEDDYWKLRYTWVTKNEIAERRKHRGPEKSNLNTKFFTRYILRDKYIHINSKYVKNKRPVLLYGDSFAACYSQDSCFEHILNNDETFSKKHYLLNYGVGGYGLDQIFLLFKNSVSNYNNPFVVISLMTLDLDRSILSVRDGPKPFFTVENNMLKLHEKPIQINKKIIIEIINELKARNIDYIFLIFHPPSIRGIEPLNENITNWRSSFIRNMLDNNITYIWSKDVILQNMKTENLSMSDYFVKGGHPSAYQRMLISQKIINILIH
jgi:hypothetical protein